MDKDIPYEKRMERIEHVLQELCLKKCENTLIGIPGRIKGLSGGEMRRLSFASEVLTNPPLMFCDEPTSGLDAYMAQNIVEVMKQLTCQGKTIVATIHQPSSIVFNMFDRILLMGEGRVAFFGTTDEAMHFFQEKAQLPCPSNFNPADHFIHALAVTVGNEHECRNRVNKVCDIFARSEYGDRVSEEITRQLDPCKQEANAITFDEKKLSSPYQASWVEQFKALIYRGFLSSIKEPMLVKMRIVEFIIIAIILGSLYFGQENDQTGITNINGALFLMMSVFSFDFANINVFSYELPIFLREHFNGMYRSDVYFLSKQIVELPLTIGLPIIFVSIFYYMVGFNSDADKFFWCCLICILIYQVVVSFGYLISCITPNLQAAVTLATPSITPLFIVGGFFMNSGSISDWWLWLKYVSWFSYGNELLVINQWDNVTFPDCNHVTADTPCFIDGDHILTSFDFDKDNWTLDIMMLIVLAVAFRVVAYILLLMKTFKKSK